MTIIFLSSSEWLWYIVVLLFATSKRKFQFLCTNESYVGLLCVSFNFCARKSLMLVFFAWVCLVFELLLHVLFVAVSLHACWFYSHCGGRLAPWVFFFISLSCKACVCVIVESTHIIVRWQDLAQTCAQVAFSCHVMHTAYTCAHTDLTGHLGESPWERSEQLKQFQWSDCAHNPSLQPELCTLVHTLGSQCHSNEDHDCMHVITSGCSPLAMLTLLKCPLPIPFAFRCTSKPECRVLQSGSKQIHI